MERYVYWGGGGYHEGDRLDVGVSDAANSSHTLSRHLFVSKFIFAPQLDWGGQGTEDGALCVFAFGCIIR